MADNDYNIIKPVKTLHNIGGLTAAKRREQRKKRQAPDQQEQKEAEEQTTEPIEESTADRKMPQADDDQNSIDFRA